MQNIPNVRIGLVAVSRDCFPAELSTSRREALAKEMYGRKLSFYECPTIVENENDAVTAIEQVSHAGANALVVFLGNFGPETPETLLAKYFKGPVMYIAAAEESGRDLKNGRGDAYCGMLNCSYNLGLRGLNAYIPENPVEDTVRCADLVVEFEAIARVMIGLSKLKLISFGPRPQDFLACNAPIKQLYDMGIELEENSELDLFVAYEEHAGDPRIKDIVSDMKEELGAGCYIGGVLNKLAQFELTLLDWANGHKGAREYVAFANKCWPAFQTKFNFVPCYVNSRFNSRAMPVGCEVDIYGALSQYIGACLTQDAVTLLDINNTVPQNIYESGIRGKFGYSAKDVFMGFHCGNTPRSKLSDGKMKNQLIMERSLGPDGNPDITRGTLEGDIAPGDMTLYRVQGAADGELRAYVAQGEILPVASRSFGGIGVIGISEMARFYRHVLIEKRYPHHGAVAFGHCGKQLFEIFKLLGVRDISHNRPKHQPYPTENPF